MLHKLPPFEFENWAVIALGGIPNKAQVGDMGIDGRIFHVSAIPNKPGAKKGETAHFDEFMDAWYPIQVKQRRSDFLRFSHLAQPPRVQLLIANARSARAHGPSATAKQQQDANAILPLMQDQSPVKARGEFRRLKESGHRRSPGMAIGWGIARARDLVARGLIAVGVTPNALTILGFIASCVAGVCLLFGGGYTHRALREMGQPPYVMIAAYAIVFACAMDMLDGAVAKLGKQQTPLGAVLDSTIDRLSDAAIYVGLVGHFVIRGNLTYGVLAALAMMDAMMISYVKARAECIIADCEAGYWARGERCVAILVGMFFGAMPAMLWQQSISPGFTAFRRVIRFHRVLAAKAKGLPEPPDVPPHGLGSVLRPWRCPRGSIPYDVITAMNILFIPIAARLHPIFGPDRDPLRSLLGLTG